MEEEGQVKMQSSHAKRCLNSHTINCNYNIDYVKVQIIKNKEKAKIGVSFLG